MPTERRHWVGQCLLPFSVWGTTDQLWLLVALVIRCMPFMWKNASVWTGLIRWMWQEWCLSRLSHVKCPGTLWKDETYLFRAEEKGELSPFGATFLPWRQLFDFSSCSSLCFYHIAVSSTAGVAWILCLVWGWPGDGCWASRCVREMIVGLRALVSAATWSSLLVFNFTALSASHSCRCSSPLSVGFSFSPF